MNWLYGSIIQPRAGVLSIAVGMVCISPARVALKGSPPHPLPGWEVPFPGMFEHDLIPKVPFCLPALVTVYGILSGDVRPVEIF